MNGRVGIRFNRTHRTRVTQINRPINNTKCGLYVNLIFSFRANALHLRECTLSSGVIRGTMTLEFILLIGV